MTPRRDDNDGSHELQKMLESGLARMFWALATGVIVLLGITATTAWKAQAYIGAIDSHFEKLEMEIRVRTVDRWGGMHMQLWTQETASMNPGLKWPNVREIQRDVKLVSEDGK